MAYQSWSVVFGEQPSAAKWNILGTNDASFNDGTGFATSAITADKVATNTQILAYTEGLTSGQSITTAWPTYTDATGMSVTFTTPASCTRILLRAEGPVSADTAGINMYFAITNSSNTIQVERVFGADQSNANQIHTYSLSRRITVTASTSYTFKLRFASNGTASVVINNGNVADRPSCIWVERA